MFFAAGAGAYGAAMFHLFTHAFFKALLFLGAGSVIHAMHHEQDMRYYGNLRKQIPITYRSEEHTSELQSLMRISYAVFCLKKKKKRQTILYTKKTNKQHRATNTHKQYKHTTNYM